MSPVELFVGVTGILKIEVLQAYSEQKRKELFHQVY